MSPLWVDYIIYEYIKSKIKSSLVPQSFPASTTSLTWSAFRSKRSRRSRFTRPRKRPTHSARTSSKVRPRRVLNRTNQRRGRRQFREPIDFSFFSGRYAQRRPHSSKTSTFDPQSVLFQSSEFYATYFSRSQRNIN